MSPKYINFFLYSWFISTFICIAIEGSYFSNTQGSIIDQLSILQAIKSGGIFAVGSATINFFQGLMRILLWDYSFYSGQYEVLRWVWFGILTPGAVWGVLSSLAPVFANLIPRVGV